MSTSTPTRRVDIINIFLLVLSGFTAIMLPFELFLFVYAVLGPLHYLTEISWLHDRKYFTTGKYDITVLILGTLLIMICMYRVNLGLEDSGITDFHINRLLVICLGSAIFFAFIKNNFIKWAGVSCLVLISALSDKWFLPIIIFTPTLVHVYVFTFFFMLSGALKSRSRYGYAGATLHFLVPFILYYVFMNVPPLQASQYGIQTYDMFKPLNTIIMNAINGGNDLLEDRGIAIYTSSLGVTIMRFIAFAYTYHYMNWFSKTQIIRWHQVPRARFIGVIILWIASIAIYFADYKLGFNWLFFLSLLHVTLEFPLNAISVRNIFTELRGRIVAKGA
jgi:hypothetical protein